MIDSKGPADRQPGSIRFDSIRFDSLAVQYELQLGSKLCRFGARVCYVADVPENTWCNVRLAGSRYGMNLVRNAMAISRGYKQR